MRQAAKANPDANFCIFNETVSDVSNIECTMPDTLQIGEIAGIMAGLLTKTNSIGIIGGVELDTTKNKIDGATKAAMKVNPSCKVATPAYAGSFSDSAKGKELASNLIEQDNVDVLFGDASFVDTGAREALAEHTKADGVDRYDIGQPGDLGSAADNLIATSVCAGNVKMTSQVLSDLENGQFGKKVIKGDLSNGGVYVGTISDAIVSADVRQKFNDCVDMLKNGTF